MKGYLTSNGEVLQLSPKVTTIGRESCNIIIKAGSVDSQHAVIDYNESGDGGFLLQDLNTAQGTYVNNTRVQNTSVRLATGDVIRFGGSPTTYEFSTSEGKTPLRNCWLPNTTTTTTETLISLPPPIQRPAPTPLGTTVGPPSWPSVEPGGGRATSRNVHFGFRARPQSAGPKEATTARLPSTIYSGCTHNVCSTVHHNHDGAANTRSASSINLHNSNNNNTQSYNDMQIQLRLLNEEMRRMSAYEAACKTKDELANHLREEVTSLQKRLRHAEVGITDLSQQDVHQKLLQIEKEVSTKKVDAQSLRKQISKMRPDLPRTGQSVYHVRCTDTCSHHPSSLSPARVGTCAVCRGVDVVSMRQELEILRQEKGSTDWDSLRLELEELRRMKGSEDLTAIRQELEALRKQKGGADTTGMRQELEALRKEKGTTDWAALRRELEALRNGKDNSDMSGLIAELEGLKRDKGVSAGRLIQIQQDMTNKDVSISRMAKTIEELKQDVQTRDNQISALNASIKRSHEDKMADSTVEDKDKELAALRHKLSNVEDLNTAQKAKMVKLEQDLSEMKTSSESNQATMRKLKSDHDAVVVKHESVEKAERLVRVALEQASKRLEKMRGAVIQTAYSSPGAKVPDKQINDEDLIVALKNYANEKLALEKQVKNTGSEKKLIENTKKLTQQLNESVDTSGKKK